MAIDVNNIQTGTSADVSISEQNSALTLNDKNQNVSNTDDVKVSTVSGLSASEKNDPNSIKVTIADPNTPIVVLYGPPS